MKVENGETETDMENGPQRITEQVIKRTYMGSSRAGSETRKTMSAPENDQLSG